MKHFFHILAVDIGNTRIKWAIYKAPEVTFLSRFFAPDLTVFDRHLLTQDQIVDQGHATHHDMATLKLPDIAYSHSTQVIIANVANAKLLSTLKSTFSSNQRVHHFVSEAVSVNIQNHYDNPTQLGADRWASVIGAEALGGENCVIVNAGTAVTIDVLQTKSDSAKQTPPKNAASHKKLNHFSQTHRLPPNLSAQVIQAHYRGGLILPGLQLMQSQLTQNTATLAAKNAASSTLPNTDFIAQNTHLAIQYGAMTAICSSIHHVAQRLAQDIGDTPEIFVSGGDAKTIVEYYANRYAHHSPTSASPTPIVLESLVLCGLYYYASLYFT
jgi:pantothenate kinase type III